MSDAKTHIQSGGEVNVEELTLINTELKYLNIKDYLVELNLYESILSPTLYGSIMVLDSRNLIREFNITGNEYLSVKFKTPNLQNTISKIFRIYKVSDRSIVRDLSTQSYILHFISKEAIVDSYCSLYQNFEGKISDVVKKVYDKFLTVNREYEIAPGKPPDGLGVSNIGIQDTKNSVKFVSPGWTPFQIISWCASKAIPEEGRACNYLFFETNKSFMFTSIERLYKANNENNQISVGPYFYGPVDIPSNKNPISKMFYSQSVSIQSPDLYKNIGTGYFDSIMLTLDVLNKKSKYHRYDYDEEFYKYEHVEKNPVSVFNPNGESDVIFNNPNKSVMFYPTQDPVNNFGLFDNYQGNFNEEDQVTTYYQNRKANLQDLQNLRLNIEIPGRTDIEAGRMMYFNFPDVSPKDSSSGVSDGMKGDRLYAGFYLISAIRHKVNLKNHFMTVELVKDSFNKERLTS